MKPRWVVLLAGAMLSAVVVLPAEAAPGKRPRSPEQVFARRDKNHDGQLSLAEFQGRGKKNEARVEKRFHKLDTNGDNQVSLEEFKQAIKRKR